MRPLNLILALRRHLGAAVTPDVIEEAVVASLPERLVPKAPIPGPRKIADYTLQVEPFRSIAEEVGPLMAAFWREVADMGRGIPAKINTDRFFFTESIGQFYLVTLRKGTELVGYFGVQITRSPLAEVLIGYEESVYVKPEHRLGSLGWAMCLYAETVAKAVGVDQWRISAVPGAAPYKMARRIGAQLTAVNFTKVLKGGSRAAP